MDQTEESIRELKNRLFEMYSFEGKKEWVRGREENL